MAVHVDEEAAAVSGKGTAASRNSEQQPTPSSESTPLLSPPPGDEQDVDVSSEKWRPPRAFIWIEIALLANVFLSGFDGTITASTYAVISSDFDAANSASWLTTSYLITSTAFQPLYGRFSDILGRRSCFFFSTITFALGCLGCSLAKDVITLNLMRALTGIGGGGLITLATIVNSDMIPLAERGMYQAGQNVAWGIGSICGASFGGAIADTIGWRWCFLLQVPVSVAAIIVGYFVIANPPRDDSTLVGESASRALLRKIDVSGSLLLILGLSSLLLGTSLGGNQLAWSDLKVIGILIASAALLIGFLVVEAKTSAMPIMPLWMLKGRTPVFTQISNFLCGVAAYSFLFMVPLFFQVVLFDSATKAGGRLVVPALATPIGGLITGYSMSRWGCLTTLVRLGTALMFLGNALMLSLSFTDATWKYHVFLFPANLGQGIVYPAILFTFLSSFGHNDHAISSSIVYLIRSLGMVSGVAMVSAIVQNTLKSRLPIALDGFPGKEEFITEIRHSVSALRDLPDEIQMPARLVYYQGMRLAFLAATVCGLGAWGCSWVIRSDNLRRTRRGST